MKRVTLLAMLATTLIVTVAFTQSGDGPLENRRAELTALVGGGLLPQDEDPPTENEKECKEYKKCTEVYQENDRCNEAGNPNNPFWITGCGQSCPVTESCASPTDKCKAGNDGDRQVYSCQTPSTKQCDPNGDGMTDCGDVRQGVCSVSSIFWDQQGCPPGQWRLKCTGGNCQDSGTQNRLPCPDWYKCKTL